MKQRHKAFAILAAAALLLAACTQRTGGSEAGVPNGTGEAPSAAASPPAQGGAAAQTPGEAAETSYIQGMVRQTVDQIVEPGMSEYERAKAAFDYMIDTAVLLDPVGLDLWRIRGDDTQPPPYVENRSLCILLFQFGKCEDYAAALTLLLQEMGLEAQYVPGLTYSTQGELVDHAWTVAKIDGVWYHLDCQLEQNISRHGSVRYKYFMRSDATLQASHRWGQNLIDARLLTAAQNEEIAQFYIPPACPENYPTPERRSCVLAEAPDVAAVQAAIDAEFAAYEQAHGPLEPLESNVIPPVFALEGYGPQD